MRVSAARRSVAPAAVSSALAKLASAILVRAGMVTSDRRLAITCRSMSSSTGVDTVENDKAIAGGRLSLTAIASAMPSRLYAA